MPGSIRPELTGSSVNEQIVRIVSDRHLSYRGPHGWSVLHSSPTLEPVRVVQEYTGPRLCLATGLSYRAETSSEQFGLPANGFAAPLIHFAPPPPSPSLAGQILSYVMRF